MAKCLVVYVVINHIFLTLWPLKDVYSTVCIVVICFVFSLFTMNVILNLYFTAVYIILTFHANPP